MDSKLVAIILAAVMALSGAVALTVSDDRTEAAALDFGTLTVEEDRSVDLVFKYNRTAYDGYGNGASAHITGLSTTDKYTVGTLTEDATGRCIVPIGGLVQSTSTANFDLAVVVDTGNGGSVTLQEIHCKVVIDVIRKSTGTLSGPDTVESFVGEILVSQAFSKTGVQIRNWYAYGLPAGLTVSKEGRIIGMPGADSQSNSSVRIVGVDADGNTYSKTVDVQVKGALQVEVKAEVGGIAIKSGSTITLFAESGRTGLDLTISIDDSSTKKNAYIDGSATKVHLYHQGVMTAYSLDQLDSFVFDGVGSYSVNVDVVITEGDTAATATYYGHVATGFTVNILSAAAGNTPANIVITPVSA